MPDAAKPRELGKKGLWWRHAASRTPESPAVQRLVQVTVQAKGIPQAQLPLYPRSALELWAEEWVSG